MITRCRIDGCDYDGECRADTFNGSTCGLLSCPRKLCGPHTFVRRAIWAAGAHTYCLTHDLFDCPFAHTESERGPSFA